METTPIFILSETAYELFLGLEASEIEAPVVMPDHITHHVIPVPAWLIAPSHPLDGGR